MAFMMAFMVPFIMTFMMTFVMIFRMAFRMTLRMEWDFRGVIKDDLNPILPDGVPIGTQNFSHSKAWGNQ